MEPAEPVVNHIFCPLHKDLIRKVGINNDNRTDLSLLCIDCMEGSQNQERHTLENFLKQIAQSYSQIPKLQQLPDSTNQILNTENEIVANFSFHIEKQKEIVNTVIDKLRQSVYQKLESKKRQLIVNLEGQLKAFEEVLSFYKQKIFTYKENHQNDHAEGQEATVTFASKKTKATELKELLQIHYDNMKKSEIFAQVKGDEAKKIVTDAIVTMDIELMKAQALKPTISFGVNAVESYEDTLKVWNEQIDSTINGLKIEVKDTVKPIEFQLEGLINFDSVILKNDVENKKMIANWVLETSKARENSFYLLYRGSRDGFGSKNFHDKCDNKRPTVVIIENTIGNKFGGYAAVSWTSINDYNHGCIKTDGSFRSFLFSVDKKEKLCYKPESNRNALYHDPSCGPVFGHSAALTTYDNMNANNDSYCALEDAYQQLKGGGYISGAKNFTVKEIEVYSLVSK